MDRVQTRGKLKVFQAKDLDIDKMEKAPGGGLGGEATMTAVTRAQHAKPWESFPASSKTFMEFSQRPTSQ